MESVYYVTAESFDVDRTRFIMAIILFWRGGNRQKTFNTIIWKPQTIHITVALYGQLSHDAK